MTDKLISLVHADSMDTPMGLDAPPMLSFCLTRPCEHVTVRVKGLHDGLAWSAVPQRRSGMVHLRCGAPPRPFSAYRWEAEVIVQGRKSVSESLFVTGSLAPGQWRAPFIFDREPHGRRVRMARQVFQLPSMPETAYLFLAAFGDRINALDLRLNGRRVIQDASFPGMAEHYVALEAGWPVTHLLHTGANVLAASFLRGFSVILRLGFHDSHTEWVSTAEGWHFLPEDMGPFAPFAHDGAGRRRRYEDVRPDKALPGWTDDPQQDFPGMVPCLEPHAKETHHPLFVRFRGEPVVCGQPRAAVSSRQTENGWLLDLGHESRGYPCFSAPSAMEALGRLHHPSR